MIRMLWLLGMFLVFGSTDVLAKPGKTQRCLNQRESCRKKCAGKAYVRERKCLRSALKEEQACLKKAHRQGRTCVKKLECADADRCYAACKEQNDPVVCYNKKGCDRLKEACYQSCQTPLGQALKACMKSTRERRLSCEQDKARWLFACQTRCPSCS
jgi:hypothetical protein